MSDAEAPVVLITGGSRGIGLSLVRRFSADGWRVAACATSEAGARAGDPSLAAACDVTDAKAVAAWVAGVAAALGRVDAVINNAGLAGSNGMAPEDDDALWHRILAVNLDGTYHVCKQAAPLLPDGRGRIINIASVLALRGVADQTAYCAAKHGVLGFTRALAQRLAPRGITVNAICPGWTRSDMARERWRELGIDESAAAAAIPIGRIAEPDEVAATAAFLASAAAGSITGQAIAVDGGSTL